MSPLARIGSVKVKLGLLIVAAVAISATMSQVGFRLGWPIWLRPVIAGVVSLALVQALARGMTRPLRDMAAATTAMANGETVRPIETRSRDEIGQLAAAFNSMVTDLGALERERRDLVANAAHELRTPIAGLQATLENLRDGVVAPDDEILERLSVQADRLGHVVTGLLDLSRLESDDVPAASDRVDLAAVATAAIDVAVADRPDVAPRLVRTGDLALRGDEQLLERLVTNLVRNAVVHGAGADVEVDLRADDDAIVVSVADRGPGLGSADPAQVFDRFVRSDASRSESRPGTGLGLAICAAIVARHGGTIAAEDRSPSGARFTVVLPRRPESETP
ncbi:MAG: HAMP domain-containing sensor histidine kinase [Actinomycetota bacterium]